MQNDPANIAPPPPPPPPSSSAAPDPNAYHAFPGDEMNEDGTHTQEPIKEEYLHPCCQKELQATRIHTKLMTKLRAADVTRHAMERHERARVGGMEEALLQDAHRHEHGSGCCGMMLDYPALAALREARGLLPSASTSESTNTSTHFQQRVYQNDHDNEEDDPHEEGKEEEEEDSDDELLRELEAGDDLGAGGFMEIRLAEMMRKAQEAAELRHLGVGLHTDLPPTHMLDLVHLRCCQLVCHCYDPHSSLSAAMDLCLEGLAARYPGTRFVRTPFKASVSVRERLRVPSPPRSAAEGEDKAVLVCFRDGCVVDACYDYGRRFGGSRGGEEIYEEALEQWLRHCQVLVSDPLDVTKARKLLAGSSSSSGRKTKKGKRGGLNSFSLSSMRSGAQERDEEVDGGESDDEDEEGEFYDCGLEGCHKAFVHSHVGIEGVDLPKEFGSSSTTA